MKIKKLHQAGAEIEFPAIFGFVPWRHHVEIVTKCKTIEEALFYVRKTIEESWSRSTLVDCIKVNLYQSSGNALTNFAEKLPAIQGKLAQEIVKDTYDFSFASLSIGHNEEELEDVKEILSHEMVNAAKLHVPLEVDMHTGKNWYEAK